MISDTIELAGRRAYFTRGPTGSLDLAAGSTGYHSFSTPPLAKGVTWQINGIDIVFTVNNVADLSLHLDNPILSLSVMRELLPGYYGDPYRTRIHGIAGAEDFDAGKVEGGFFTDINGNHTLVANDDGPCRWDSPIYTYPTPINLDCFAWHLAISQNAPHDTLRYSVSLKIVQAGGVATTIPLVTDADASDQRWKSGLGLDDVVSLQVVFEATPGTEGDFSKILRGRRAEGVGMSLLRGLSVLETVTSPLAFHSLPEMLAVGRFYPDLDLQLAGPQTLRFSGSVEATLSVSDTADPTPQAHEHIEITIDTDHFSSFQARLTGTEDIFAERGTGDG